MRRAVPAIIVLALAAAVVLAVCLRTAVGRQVASPSEFRPPARLFASSTITVQRHKVRDVVDWPGTVMPRITANVAPKFMARVMEVRVDAGAAVRAGDVIAVLDDRDLRARADQARAVVVAAQAQAAQAEADLRRTRTLVRRQAATEQELDVGETAAKAAEAQLEQARQAADEIEVLLGEATVRAPFAGVVAARMADPGDMSIPGRPIAIVHDPESLRLEVRVGEHCARNATAGRLLRARFDAPSRAIAVRVDAVSPTADPQSHTVLVKASVPSDAGARPGAFGVLEVPCGDHEALLVPRRAIRRTGQLESVHVAVADHLQLRHVRSGKAFEGMVEVVSGLSAGERVVSGD